MKNTKQNYVYIGKLNIIFYEMIFPECNHVQIPKDFEKTFPVSQNQPISVSIDNDNDRNKIDSHTK